MAKISVILEAIAKGNPAIDLKDPKFADILSSAVEVPDDFLTAANGLLTVDAASTHPQVKAKVKAEAYDAIDAQVLNMANGLSEEDLAEIKAEKSTNKKIELLHGKQKAALESALVEAKKGGNSTAQKAIEELQAKWEADKQAYEAKLTEKDTFIKNSEFNNASTNFFAKYPNLVKSVSGLSPVDRMNVIKSYAEKNGGKVVLENGNFKVVDANDGDFYYNGKVTSLDELSGAFMAENEWLKVSDGGNAGGEKVPQTPGQVDTRQENTAAIDAYSKAIEAINAS